MKLIPEKFCFLLFAIESATNESWDVWIDFSKDRSRDRIILSASSARQQWIEDVIGTVHGVISPLYIWIY